MRKWKKKRSFITKVQNRSPGTRNEFQRFASGIRPVPFSQPASKRAFFSS